MYRCSLRVLFFAGLFSLQSALAQIGPLTTADGFRWKNPLPFGGSFHSVTILDSLTIIAGGDYGVIIYSLDGGESWRQSAVPPGFIGSVRRIEFFADRRLGWAVGSGRILLSRDRGRSWLYGAAPDNCTPLDLSIDEDVLYLLSALIFDSTRYAVMSIDEDGQEWGLAWPEADQYRNVKRIRYPYIWGDRQIYRLSSLLVDANRTIRDVAPVPNSADFLFLWDTTLCRNQSNNRIAEIGYSPIMLKALSQQVFYIIGKHIHRSRDGGGSIEDLGDVGVRLLALDFHGLNIGFACGEESRIVFTVNSGNFWSNSIVQQSQLSAVRCIYYETEDIAYAQASDVESTPTYYTEDGGNNWRRLLTANRRFIRVHKFHIAVNRLNAFVLDSARAMYRMNVVEQAAAYRVATGVQDFFFLDDRYAWYVTRREIFFSNDGGVFWMPLNTFQGDSVNTVFFLSTQVGYVGGDRGTILKTTNGGANWTDVSVAGVDVNGLWFVDENIGFVAGDEGVFFKTVNGGATWRPRNTYTLENLHILRFYTPQIGYVVTSQGYIVTRDGGDHFTHYYAPLGLEVGSEQKTPSLYVMNNMFLDFAYARGANILKGCDYRVTVPDKPNDLPEQYILLVNFPNPFNSTTTARCNLPYPAEAALMLRDLQGRTVARLYEGRLSAGLFELPLHSGTLPAGVYFLQLQLPYEVKTSKVIIMR